MGGEVLPRGGKLVRLDREEAARRLRGSVPAGHAAEYRRLNEPVGRLRQAVAAWYEPGVRELEAMEREPFYPVNIRRKRGPGPLPA